MKKTLLIIFCCFILGSCLLFTPKLNAKISEVFLERDLNKSINNNEMYPKGRLYTPTEITKLNGYYFIVDCYHHRIIYNRELATDLKSWSEFDYEFSGPHSIATDGSLYVVDNAGKDEILVFNTNFKLIQTISEIWGRPHRTIYTNDRFYVLSSQNQTVYSFKNENGVLVEEYHLKLDFLKQTYVRSMKVIDDKMYFVSGDRKIIVANYLSGKFEILESYDVPDSIAGMNDIEKYNGEYYITSSQNWKGEVIPRMMKTNNLGDLKSGKFQDIYKGMDLHNTPYFMNLIDGRLFFTEIGNEYNSIISIDKELNKNIHYRFQGIDPASENRRDTHPL